MLNNPQKHNIRVFSQQVDEYKKYYLRKDEKYIIKKYFKGKSILILGCGAGRTLVPLQKYGFQVTGIDITPKMVEAAKEKVADLPIKIYQMDACRLKFPKNTFDIVFFPFNSIGCIYPNIYKAVLEARRTMKPDGVCVFSTHNRFHLKALPRLLEGGYANYQGIILYRTTPLDWLKVKKKFNQVEIIPSTAIAVSWKNANWKEKIYKLLSFFDASTYFICLGKKEYD